MSLSRHRGEPASPTQNKGIKGECQMVNPVSIELNKEDVQGRTDSEKLSILVEIAFANHELLTEHGLVLFGNGNPEKGICHKVAMQCTRLNWLIGILSGVGLAIMGGIITYIVG